MRITATNDGDPFGKVSFRFDRDIEPDVRTMRAYAAAAELLRIGVTRAIEHMREAAYSAGMGADFDAGIQFARNVGGGGEESWRSSIRE
jgi:hypothetical protein